MKPYVTVIAGVQPATMPQVSGWLAGWLAMQSKQCRTSHPSQQPSHWLAAEANEAITCLQCYTTHVCQHLTDQ
jgi:hypothetical protein